MLGKIKQHDRDIRLARIQTSAVYEHAHETGHYSIWNEVKFIDRDPDWYTRRVKEAIHIRLHPYNINGIVELKFLKHGCTRSKIHDNRRSVKQRIAEGTAASLNNGTIGDRNASITVDLCHIIVPCNQSTSSPEEY